MLIESRMVFFFAIPSRRNPSLARLLFNSAAGAKKIDRDPKVLKVSESRFGMLVKSQADHPPFVSCNDCLQLDTLYSRDTIG